MKIKTGVVIAWVLSFAVTIWIWSGSFSDDTNLPETVSATTTEVLPSVQSEWKSSEMISQNLILNGQTAAKRKVQVKAEASGRISKINFNKGDRIKKGDVIAIIDSTDLPAKLTSAKALEEQRRLEYLAAQKLNKEGFQNPAQLAASLAFYELAKSQTISLNYLLTNMNIKAPFNGTVNDRMIETGSYIKTGDPVVEIVDFSSMLVSAQISENDIAKIKLGQKADIDLVNGSSASATTSFINADANPATRTFEVEFEIKNPKTLLLAGTSAVVNLPVIEKRAHFISPALLLLDDKIGRAHV